MKVYLIFEDSMVDFHRVLSLEEVCDSEETAYAVVNRLRTEFPDREYVLLTRDIVSLWDVYAKVGSLHKGLLKEDAEELVVKAMKDNPDLGNVWIQPTQN
jgi:hypothetical protein